jgi:predicted protein tyrosine phosphatase
MHKLTDDIFKLKFPYDHKHHQGDSPQWLFVCSAGVLRSATAAKIVACKHDYNTRSCGTSGHALIPLSANLIMWAEKIVFMGQSNYDLAIETFGNGPDPHYADIIKHKAITWDIPDIYPYMNSDLVDLINKYFNDTKTT